MKDGILGSSHGLEVQTQTKAIGDVRKSIQSLVPHRNNSLDRFNKIPFPPGSLT